VTRLGERRQRAGLQRAGLQRVPEQAEHPAYSDQDENVAVPPAVPSADRGSIAARVLPLDEPYAMADFLSLLDRLGLRDHAGQLADRVVAHFSESYRYLRRNSPVGGRFS
jgi:hypothetical protein